MGGEETVAALQAEEEIDSLADPFLKYPQGLADLVADSVFRNAQLRMIGDDVIRGVSLLEQRSNDGSHRSGLLYRQVDALSGVDEEGTIVKMSLFGDILEFVKTAAGPVGTTVTGTRRAITPGTMERNIARTVRNTQPSKDAFAVIDTFKRQFALMGELAMELDFFTNGGLVLTNCQSDSGFGRAVGNTGKDDTAFLKSEMRKRIGMFHKRYQPFRQQSDKKSVRLKATKGKEEISERLKSTSHYLKWK